MTEYDPDILGDHASTLIATTTAHLGVEAVHNDFGALRNAIDADTLIMPTSLHPDDAWAAWYAHLSPHQRREIINAALQMLESRP